MPNNHASLLAILGFFTILGFNLIAMTYRKGTQTSKADRLERSIPSITFIVWVTACHPERYFLKRLWPHYVGAGAPSTETADAESSESAS